MILSPSNRLLVSKHDKTVSKHHSFFFNFSEISVISHNETCKYQLLLMILLFFHLHGILYAFIYRQKHICRRQAVCLIRYQELSVILSPSNRLLVSKHDKTVSKHHSFFFNFSEISVISHNETCKYQLLLMILLFFHLHGILYAFIYRQKHICRRQAVCLIRYQAI